MTVLKRKWWNWQTHHLEGVAPKGVGVQIPPSAPTPLFFQLFFELFALGRPRNWHDYPDYHHSHYCLFFPFHCGVAAELLDRRQRGGVWRNGDAYSCWPPPFRHRPFTRADL